MGPTVRQVNERIKSESEAHKRKSMTPNARRRLLSVPLPLLCAVCWYKNSHWLATLWLLLLLAVTICCCDCGCSCGVGGLLPPSLPSFICCSSCSCSCCLAAKSSAVINASAFLVGEIVWVCDTHTYIHTNTLSCCCCSCSCCIVVAVGYCALKMSCVWSCVELTPKYSKLRLLLCFTHIDTHTHTFIQILFHAKKRPVLDIVAAVFAILQRLWLLLLFTVCPSQKTVVVVVVVEVVACLHFILVFVYLYTESIAKPKDMGKKGNVNGKAYSHTPCLSLTQRCHRCSLSLLLSLWVWQSVALFALYSLCLCFQHWYVPLFAAIR